MNEDQLLATRAKQAHRRTQELDSERVQEKQERDQAIIRLHREFAWSYGRIAREVGCSPELVAYTINPPQKKQKKVPSRG